MVGAKKNRGEGFGMRKPLGGEVDPVKGVVAPDKGSAILLAVASVAKELSGLSVPGRGEGA